MKRITWINLLAGIWLLIAPFVIGVAVSSGANDIVLGLLLLLTSLWILAATPLPAGVAWFQVLCGVWLIIAPFALGYNHVGTAMSNDVAIGILTAIVGLVESRAIAGPPIGA
jgi:SPW repeat